MKKFIQQFISANADAYAKASVVFKAIEAKDFQSTLAEAGIMGKDIKVFATIYVAATSKEKVEPHKSQRGDTLVFKKDTVEYNRVKYIVDVATGVRSVYTAKKPETTHTRITPQARKAAEAFIKLCGSKADAIAALRAI